MAKGEASYSQVERAIWTKARFRSVGDDGRILFLYLLICPHGTQSGLYRLPPGYACEDLQWGADRYKKALDELIRSGLIKYDERHQIIFDPHQLEKFPPQNSNQVKGMVGKLKELPTTDLFKDLIAVAQTIERKYISELTDYISKRLANGSETVPQGYGNPGPKPKPKPEAKGVEEPLPDTTPVDNSNGTKKELIRKILEEFTPRQAREVTLFLETSRRKHPEALIHCLNRLIEEKARGSPPTAIGSWLEAVLREEDKNYNARDSEAECNEHKRQPGLTSIGDILGMKGEKKT